MPTPRINHNSHLTEAHRTMSVHSADVSRQIGMLSSGLRINRSSDDPASVALADGIHSEVRAITEGTRNIQQAFSLIQVADGSLNEISAIVNRMRGLAMQGANSSYNDADRMNIHSEFNELRMEVDRIASTTTYNGRRLLAGGNSRLAPTSTALAVASESGLSDVLVSEADVGTYTFVDEPGDGFLTLGNGVQTQTVSIATAIGADDLVADGESHKIRFDLLGVEVTLTGQDVSGATGSYGDGVLEGQTLIVEEDRDLAFQVGPSETSNDVNRIQIGDMRASGRVLDLGKLSVGTRADAQGALTRLSEAITKVSDERNRLGAFQNRLQLSIATSESVVERMVDAESRIREVDVARAASSMTHSQILSQAATSIAGQSDADIDRILSLLR